MPRAIICAGPVRNPDRFGRFLDALAELAASAPTQVIFSTWSGELDKYPPIASKLAGIGAMVVEQHAPDLLLPGQVLHELAQLDLALTLLDDDVFVLKTRPDLADLDVLVSFLQEEPVAVTTAALAAPFGHRMVTFGSFIAHPFYINNIHVMGMAADLRKLLRLPFLTTLRYMNLAPEQQYWSSPFISDLPVFDMYFRTHVGLIFNDRPRHESLRAILVESLLFARAIACFGLILRDSFGFAGGDFERAQLREEARSHTLEALMWDPLDVPALERNPDAFSNGVRSIGLWETVLAGQCAPSALGERVAAMAAAYDRPDGLARMRAESDELVAEAEALGTRIEASVGGGPTKHLRDGPFRRRVADRPAEWTMAQNAINLTARLEAENTQMRRHIDELLDDLERLQRRPDEAG
jgi:hypothetical protein